MLLQKDKKTCKKSVLWKEGFCFPILPSTKYARSVHLPVVSVPKDKLLRITNNNEGDRKSILKSKKEKTKNGLYKPTRNSPFKLKREKIKKSFHKPVRKNLFKSKIEEVKKLFMV